MDPANRDHNGLLLAVNELHRLSTVNIGRQRAYKTFPVATGMILRTAYEQALRLRLMKVTLWHQYLSSIPNNRYPKLSSMENFIKQVTNKSTMFPDTDMVSAFDRIIRRFP